MTALNAAKNLQHEQASWLRLAGVGAAVNAQLIDRSERRGPLQRSHRSPTTRMRDSVLAALGSREKVIVSQ